MKTLAILLLLSGIALAQGNNQNNFGGSSSSVSKAYYAISNGLVCNGASDDTAGMNALLTTVKAAGGGTIIFPMGKTCLMSSGVITIPANGDSWVDGAGTVQSSVPIRLTCDGPMADSWLQSAGATVAQSNLACTLNLTFNAPTAKIVALGMGMLEIDHLSLIDTNTADCSPNKPAFVFTSNTRIYAHQNNIIGAFPTIPSPATPTLALIAGTSTGAAQFIKVTYVWSSQEESYATANATLTPSVAQQIQVTSPPAFGVITGYNIYASATVGGTYFLQNTGGAINIGTNYTVPGTLIASGATAPINNTAYSCNDGFILGGTATTQNSTDTTGPFQGYGTVIENNFFNQVARAVFTQIYTNDIKIIWNKVWSQGGCASCGVFEFHPTATTLATGSHTIIGNVLEVVHYNFGLNGFAESNPTTAFQNNCYDPGEFSNTICNNLVSNSKVVVYGGYSGAYNIAPSDISTAFIGTDTTWSRSSKTAIRMDDYFINDKGGHFKSSDTIGDTTTDTSPQCTMVAGTCGYTFTTTWNAAPRCTGTWSGTGTMTGILKVSTTTTVATCASSVGTDTAQCNMICVGAPR